MSSTNRGGKRAPSDFYRTEPYCVRRLLEALKLPGGVWFEPCAGDGAIIKTINSLRNDVQWLACDIRKACREPLSTLVGEDYFEITDFLKVEPPETKVDVLLTNPPFSLAEEFLVHGLKFAHWVALLLRLDFLGSVRRSELLRSNMPNVYELPNRPSFGKNKKGKQGHDSNEYAWFVWPPWRNRTQGVVKILALTSQEERKADRDSKGGIAVPSHASEASNKKVADEVVDNVTANETDENAGADATENAIATETENAKEIEMAYLPTGFGADVEKAEATIPRQILKEGEYVFLHRQTFVKNTKKGDAVIIEHKIVEAKPIVAGITPSPVGTNWGYFLPMYGDAAVMLKPNLKGYILGILGLNEKQVAQGQIGAACDRMGGPDQACCGMLVRGTTFKTSKQDGDDFVGMNWSPVTGENVFGSPNVVARRNEILAELGLATAGQAPQQPQIPQGMVQTPAGLAVPAGAMPQGGMVMPQTQMQMPAAPQVPVAPQAAPQVPMTPAQKLALAMQQGWQKHPNTPGYYWHPGLPAGANLKSEAELTA